ncbi:Lrp/AsnC family transcriptional regulator [Candidatus Micrarchaeota archaeon]|nr:Lrp/AsnC family transcriptional regulator [Candidatus Micrarchaeota archaeon]
MKIDSTDKRLVFLLDDNARASLSELASQLRLSREAVNYRIKKLQRSGTIKAFITKLNFSKLGLVNYIVYLKLNNLNSGEYKQFVDALSQKRYITWLASMGGRFDLVLEITAASITEFDEQFSKLLDEYPDNIGNYHISTRVFQDTFGKKYLWPERIGKKTIKTRPGKTEQIDELDRKIISALVSDARLSLVDLSKRITEAPSTVSFRLKQLEKKGIISGYMTFSRMQDFGYNRFKALITVRNFSKSEEENLLAFCQLHPNVYYYTKTLGSWNFELELDVQSPVDYQQFLIALRSHFSGFIQDIESLSIFEEHKFTFWPR